MKKKNNKKTKRNENCFLWDNERELAVYRCVCSIYFRKRKKHLEKWNEYINDHNSQYTYNSFQYWKEHIEKKYVCFSKGQMYEFYHYITNLKRQNQTKQSMYSRIVFPLYVAILAGTFIFYFQNFKMPKITYLSGSIEHIVANLIIFMVLFLAIMFVILVIVMLILIPIIIMMKLVRIDQEKDDFYNDMMEIIKYMINKKSQ